MISDVINQAVSELLEEKQEQWKTVIAAYADDELKRLITQQGRTLDMSAKTNLTMTDGKIDVAISVDGNENESLADVLLENVSATFNNYL